MLLPLVLYGEGDQFLVNGIPTHVVAKVPYTHGVLLATLHHGTLSASDSLLLHMGTGVLK